MIINIKKWLRNTSLEEFEGQKLSNDIILALDIIRFGAKNYIDKECVVTPIFTNKYPKVNKYEYTHLKGYAMDIQFTHGTLLQQFIVINMVKWLGVIGYYHPKKTWHIDVLPNDSKFYFVKIKKRYFLGAKNMYNFLKRWGVKK